ncbi:MAG TPA: peptide ABC transporter substrate-binding protein [Caulobacteraceae bacterium]|jgi:oligopeptide transport system substrate-binding protein|nr:peptide ABC transporter substrate-binding protein [Caulobacteraceae bacterium]
MRRALAVFALTVGLLCGCSDKPVRPTCPPGKLCLHVGNTADPISLDPNKITSVQEDNIVSDMFVGLITDDAEGKGMPGAALSWTTSPDGLVWTFKLRDSVWSDGAPVTAGDFVYAMQRLQNPKSASEYSYIAYVVKNAQAVNAGKAPPEALGMKALDPHTLQITLEHPAPYLPQLLKHQTFYAIPEHVVRKWGDAWVQPGHFVSNGPFTLASWDLGDRIRLVKNPRFYDAKNVCLDEVYYYPTIDAISAERRIRRGELHAQDDIQSNRIAFLKQPDQIPAYVRTNTWLGVMYLAFNENLPKFKDRRVRQALTMAIDREFIARKLLRGGQVPAFTFVPPGIANYPGGAEPYWAKWPLEQRQAQARRLLAQAGYTAKRPLKVDIKHRNTADPTLFMPAIQADWRAVGVDVSLTQNESQIAYASYRTRDFEVADAAWIADFDDAINFLALHQSATGQQNYGDYKNPAYDALLAKADNDPDIASRAAVLVQAEHMMLEDAPVSPVYYYVSKNLVNPAVTGWIENIADHHRKRWVCFRDADARRRGG